MENLRKRSDKKPQILLGICLLLLVLALVLMSFQYLRFLFRRDLEFGAYMLWIQCLVLITLPVVFFGLFQRGFKKWQTILLVIPCIFATYQGIGALIWAIKSLFYYTIYDALPFFIETILLILMCLGINKNNKLLMRISGVFALIFALASPFISSTLCANDLARALWLKEHKMMSDSWLSWFVRRFRWPDLLYNGSNSSWPLFKSCVLLMYALIAYRAIVVEDITVPGYPPRQKKTKKIRDQKEGSNVMGSKSKVVAALLAFFLGGTGAHRYYLGYKKQGIIQSCGFVSIIIGYITYIPAMMGENIGSLLFTIIFLVYGGITSIWAFVDFIRILTGGLMPEDGSGYTEGQPKQVQVIQSTPTASDNADALEKLAKLHEQGILTDEEFRQKKADILAKM